MQINQRKKRSKPKRKILHGSVIQRKSRISGGIIYFVSCNGGKYIKIGFTQADISQRLNDLQTGNPLPLALLHYEQVKKVGHHESLLHKIFFEYKTIGEWFENIGRLADFIQQVKTIGYQAAFPKLVLDYFQPTMPNGEWKRLKSNDLIFVLKLNDYL